MKKSFLFILITGIALIILSCKKDYTCECVGVHTDGTENTVNTYSILDQRKSEAEKECESFSVEFSNVTYSCKLK